MLTEERETTDFTQRIEHAKALEASGIDIYPAASFHPSHTSLELLNNFNALQGQSVSVAGRLDSKREHGNLIFGHIEDSKGKIQAAIQKRNLPETFPLIKKYFDTGDFLGVSGRLDMTQTGEISVWADQVTMLAKALRATPEKILDPELMQRQRYLHTLINPEARHRFRTRSKIVQMMREHFINNLGALEVETPILDVTYGGAQARPFTTHHNALDLDMYLRISNELYLKRMTVGGFYEGVFEFSRDFRNEGIDKTHNPEFTQVELYMPNWDYNDMMAMSENLMAGIAQTLHGSTSFPYRIIQKDGPDREVEIESKPPWKRITIYGGIEEKLGLRVIDMDDSSLRSVCHEHEIDELTRGDMILKLFEKLWEPDLIQPTFVKDFPADTSALTKKHREDPDLTERFEAYVAGMEVMNSYSELNDPRDQRQRFATELKKREMGDRETMPVDEDFILAMEYGMPLQSGIGISVDRWTMLLTNIQHIRQAIYFPTLRPKNS